MKNYKYLIFSLIIVLFSAVGCVKDEVLEDDTPDVATSTVKLNEIMSTGDPDWIELYNSSSESVDISGYKLTDTSQEWIIDNLTIAAGSYVTFDCDDSNVPNVSTNFKISSGGEEITLYNAAGELIDQITTPDMASQVGLTYGRENDGSDNWVVMGASKGAANSNVSSGPLLTAELISDVTDNSYYDFVVSASDPDGIRDVKLFLEINGAASIVEMAPIGDGEFTYRIPALDADTVVNYYVVATDESADKSYFPVSAPDTNASFTVVNGNPLFISIDLSNENPSDGEDITFTVVAYDATGVDEIRLYFVLDDADAETKIRVDLDTSDNITFTGDIPGQVNGTKISYYLRAEDVSGLRTYYPNEVVEDDIVVSDFNHDISSTWPYFEVAPLVILDQLVINEINGSGDPFDYIELYNSTNAAIDISGYKVYDSNGIAEAYVIPDGTTIASQGFFLIETGGGSPQGQFGISGSGEDITLVNASDEIVDQLLQVDWPGVPLVARKLDGAELWDVPDNETPGTSNN